MIKSKRAERYIAENNSGPFSREMHIDDVNKAVELAEEEVHTKTRREDRERAVMALCTVYCRGIVAGCRPEARACCEIRRRFLNAYDDERPAARRVWARRPREELPLSRLHE